MHIYSCAGFCDDVQNMFVYRSNNMYLSKTIIKLVAVFSIAEYQKLLLQKNIGRIHTTV